MKSRLLVTALAVVLAVLALAPGVHAAPPQADTWHMVRWGETLWRISRQFGVPVNVIAEANAIANPSRIYAGQWLLIPGVETGPCDCQFYAVVRGDTLYSISRRFGVPVSALARANRLANPNLITVGQRLIVTTSGISIDAPATGAVLSGSVHVSGVGSGFENTLVAEVRAADGTLLVRRNAMVNADVGQVGPYAVDLTFTPPHETQHGQVVVWRGDMATGGAAGRTCVDVTLQGSGG